MQAELFATADLLVSTRKLAQDLGGELRTVQEQLNTSASLALEDAAQLEALKASNQETAEELAQVGGDSWANVGPAVSVLNGPMLDLRVPEWCRR